MEEKINTKILRQELKGKIRGFYPYFIGFYFLSLFVSIFSKTWHAFFYWPGFHASAIFFTLLFILTFKFSFSGKFKIFPVKFAPQFKKYLLVTKRQLAKLTWRDYLKISLIILVLAFALYKNIIVLDFLILAYALISFLYILDSRLSAGAALVLLASCPILLIAKKDSLAETMAVYAYYFLVITVITQIRELRKSCY